jgi:hypothetical protein
MERLLWIIEEGDINPETQTGQKFLDQEQICFQGELPNDNDFSWTCHN